MPKGRRRTGCALGRRPRFWWTQTVGRRELSMGLVYANIGLSNPRKPELKSVAVKSLVDTGAVMLCIPEHIANQLSLEQNGTRDVSTAEDMDLVVQPADTMSQGRRRAGSALCRRPLSRQVTVNPESPNFPHHIIKKFSVT